MPKKIRSRKVAKKHMQGSRNLLLKLAVVAGLSRASEDAWAKNPFLNNVAADPTTQATQAIRNQTARAAEANTATQRSIDVLRRSVVTNEAVKKAQEAARAAALAAQSSVVNGLKPGGLQVFDGALDSNGQSLNPDLWIGAKAPTETVATDGKALVTIEQTDPKAILTWNTFNVGRETDVYFNQKAGDATGESLGADGWIALNRVIDPSGDPSKILGKLHADGQVWVINRNGVLFGGSSQVDTHALVVSSLDIQSGLNIAQIGNTPQELAARNQRFKEGILVGGKISLPGVAGDTTARETTLPRFGEVLSGSEKGSLLSDGSQQDVVVAAGAQIKNEALGHTWLIGHDVTNEGVIESSDGDIVLASGRAVFMEAADNTLRVAVDGGGNTVNNGAIFDRRGNIVLTGKRVENNGIVEATSSAQIAGSVTLLAGDYVNRGEIFDPSDTRELEYDPDTGGWSQASPLAANYVYGYGFSSKFEQGQQPYYRDPLRPLSNGDVIVGDGAIVAVTPDIEGPKASVVAPATVSTINLIGLNATLGVDSMLYAPAGSINIKAQPGSYKQMLNIERYPDPYNPIFYTTVKPVQSRIYLDYGATVTVGGLRDVMLDMDNNSLVAQNGLAPDWRLNELADSPLARDSFLRGDRVSVDIRYGTSLANLSGYYSLSEVSVLQNMTRGGKLVLDSPEIITRTESVLDISGGNVLYRDGYVPNLRILGADGRMYRLDQANPSVAYVDYAGTARAEHDRWGVKETFISPFTGNQTRFESSYAQGYDAGTLQIGPASTKETVFAGGNLQCGSDFFTQLDFSCGTGIIPKVVQLDGHIYGDVVVGRYQTEHILKENTTLQNAWRRTPVGANLTIGTVAPESLEGLASVAQFVIPSGYAYQNSVRIAPTEALPDNFTATTPLMPTGEVVLSSQRFEGGDFNTISIGTGSGDLTVDEGANVDLGAFGNFTFNGHAATINGRIDAPNGSISLNATAAPFELKDRPAAIQVFDPSTFGSSSSGDPSSIGALYTSLEEGQRNHITLGTQGVLDVSGRFADQSANTSRPGTDINGGTVKLVSSGDIRLQPTSIVDVSGGAAMSADNKLIAGAGGAIEITYGAPLSLYAGTFEGQKTDHNQFVARHDAIDYSLSLGELRGYSLSKGGALSFTLPTALEIAGDADQDAYFDNDMTRLSPTFFGRNGFSSYSFNSRNFLITDNTKLAPQVRNFIFDHTRLPGDGQRLIDTLEVGQLPIEQRVGMSLSFAVAPPVEYLIGRYPEGEMAKIGTNADIQLSPASSFTLKSLRYIAIDGRISAPGGSIVIDGGPQPRPADAGGGIALDFATVAIGPNARLEAPGYQAQSLQNGLPIRSIASGGTINIKGGVVLTDRKSIIDVHGVAGVVDAVAFNEGPSDLVHSNASGRQSIAIGGDAGSVSIYGLPTSLVGGQFVAQAGSSDARGGSISFESPYLLGDVAVSTSGFIAPAPAFEHRLMLVDGSTDSAAVYFAEVSTDLPLPVDESKLHYTTLTPQAASGYLDFSQLSRSGAEDISISASQLVIDGVSTLTAPRSLRLHADRFGVLKNGADAVPVTLSIAAPYVEFGRTASVQNSGSWQLPYVGGHLDFRNNVDLAVDATQLVLGPVNLEGMGSTVFRATGDIGLAVNVNATSGVAANLNSTGSLAFDSAQVFLQERATPTNNLPSFSITSAKSVTFDNRAQTSILRPDAAIGAILNVSAPTIDQGGTLRSPLGTIAFNAGQSLILQPGSETSVSLQDKLIPYVNRLVLDPLLAPKFAKKIDLQAPTVEIRDTAIVDASGGGDLYSPPFVRGNGGSIDILTTPGMFAVVPGTQAQSGMPANRTTNLQVGDRVFLQGNDELPAGEYVLLPPQYALLEGAYAVQIVKGGYASMPRSSALLDDGSWLVGGVRVDDGIRSGDALYSQFRLLPTATVRAYSFYDEGRASEVLAEEAQARRINVPSLPENGGTLSIAASKSLLFAGDSRLGAPADTVGGKLSLSSKNVAVVSANQAVPSAPLGEGYLYLDPAVLKSFGAETLEINADTDLIVRTTDNSPLQAANIALSGKSHVVIDSDAVVKTEGRSSEGKGTLSATTAGDLIVNGGATLSASGALILSADRSLQTSDEPTTLKGESLTLASNKVSLGDVPAGTLGIVLTNAALKGFDAVEDLRIQSKDRIDFYNQVSIGSVNAGTVTLDAKELHGNDATVDINAKTVQLVNTAGVANVTTVPDSGQLSIHADTLALATATKDSQGLTSIASGDLTIAGFGQLNVTASQVIGAGTASLKTTAPVAVTTDLLSVNSGVDFTLMSDNSMAIHSLSGADLIADGVGGRLNLRGSDVYVNSDIELPSGIIDIASTQSNLTLGSHATLATRGVERQFQTVTRYAPAGDVRLNSADALTIDTGALIDVSANANGGDAGGAYLDALGNASLNGTFKGTAASADDSGSFELRAASIGDFGLLNTRLNEGGMSSELGLHVAQGDLNLSAGESIAAHAVSLRTDDGAIRIGGAINASGNQANPNGGLVTLDASNNVTIDSTASISANAVESNDGFPSQSGGVTMTSRTGRVDVLQGAQVSAKGGVGPSTIAINAPRTANDVAIGELSDGLDATQIVVRGVESYTILDGSLDSEVAAMKSDAEQWYVAQAAQVAARLGHNVDVGSGIRVTAPGNLVLATDIDVGGRFGTGLVSIEAAGDLTLNGTVSDGFTNATPSATLLNAESSSLQLSASKSLTLNAGKMLRTGTGDIDLDAGGDLLLGGSNVSDRTWAVYTAGRATAHEPGFDITYLVPNATGTALTREARLGDYPIDGGNVNVRAGGDIRAASFNELHSAWQFRYGFIDYLDQTTVSNPTSLQDAKIGLQQSWSIYFPAVRGVLGALGGGNVDIRANQNLSNLTIASTTTAQQTAPIGSGVDANSVVIRGGGDINIQAGNNIFGGYTLAERGRVSVTAGGSMRENETFTWDARNLNRGLGTDLTRSLFAISDVALDITARRDILINAVLDPMFFEPYKLNAPDYFGASYFSSYTQRTELQMFSVSGDIGYKDNSLFAANKAASSLQFAGSAISPTPPYEQLRKINSLLPPSVMATAFDGGIGNSVDAISIWNLAPSPNSSIDLVARKQIGFASSNPGANAQMSVTLTNRSKDYWWTVGSPVTVFNKLYVLAPYATAANNKLRGFQPLHLDDTDPLRLYSAEGDILATIAAPKQVDVRAGRDLYLTLNIAHADQTNQSIVSAKRDIVDGKLTINGPGRVDVIAGRNVDGLDVFSRGQLEGKDTEESINFALPFDGADISVLAGAAASIQYDTFAAVYLDPENKSKVVKTYLDELRTYMAELNIQNIKTSSDNELVGMFTALPIERRTVFLQQVLMSEIKQTAKEYVDKDGPRYHKSGRGRLAIETMFPSLADDSTFKADIQLHDGRMDNKNVSVADSGYVETQSSGDISIFAPYGGVYLARPGVAAVTASQSAPGVVTRRGGSIDVLAAGSSDPTAASVDGNIELVLSRIFTLQGGDILGASLHGDIRAGDGAKTVSVVKAPVASINKDGARYINVFGQSTGSGIGTLDSLGKRKDQARGDVYFFAPEGSVDAGEAGLRSTGNIFVGSQNVLNADNIDAQGEAFGLPPPAPDNTGALLSAGDTVKDALAQVVKNIQPQEPRQIPSIINGQFLGYGEAMDCSHTDNNDECAR